MKKLRHSPTEIASKLLQGDTMARNGEPIGKIAQALGVSVMTYHRWRKARGQDHVMAGTLETDAPRAPVGRHQTNRLEQLELENARLRRLVADILLEKAALEESVRPPNQVPSRSYRD